MLTSSDEKAFEARGLDLEVASSLGAKFDRGCFRFEYLTNGAFQYAKVRTPDKQFRIEPSGKRMQFWNLDALRGFAGRRPAGEYLVITEGEFDTIAVTQACGGYVVSVPNGVAGKRSEGDIIISQDNRFSYLWDHNELIKEVDQFDKIVLCVDGDEPGMILRDELALRIGDTRCWYVTYPDGCKDANDVLRRVGADGVRALIAGARPMRPGFLIKPSDVPPRALTQAHSTGWPFLDEHLKIERPELLVVTGEPGHGKGQFIRCMTFHLAHAHGWRTAYLTPEDPAHRVKRDMLRFAKREFYAPIQQPSFRGEFPPEQPNWNSTKEDDRRAEEWVDACFRISMPPEDEPITIEMVEREMESAALHHNCQAFVLDPWNEVEHAMNRGELETQYVERTLRRLLRKMRRLNLLLVIAAHPTKIGDGEKVSLYKISGSSNWKNKCQHGLIVRKQSDVVAEIEVEKSKDWERMGKPGKVWMKFDRFRCDYTHVPIVEADEEPIRKGKKG